MGGRIVCANTREPRCDQRRQCRGRLPHTRRLAARRRRGELASARWRNPWHRRRIGLRQIDLAQTPVRQLFRRPGDLLRQHHLARPRGRPDLGRQGLPPALVEPVLLRAARLDERDEHADENWRADDRCRQSPWRDRPHGARRPRPQHAGRTGSARRGAGAVPASVVRRHEAAGADRPCDLCRPRGDPRRWAGHGAGCRGAKTNPGKPGAAAAGQAKQHRHRLARSGAALPGRGSGRDPLCRPAGGARQRAERAAQSAASLYPGPGRGLATAWRPTAAPGHRWPGALVAGSPRGLPLPAALRQSACVLGASAARAQPGRPRVVGRRPSARGVPLMGSAPPILEIDGLQKTYGRGGLFGQNAGRRALDGVSMALAGGSGQILAVVGESGSGKTTLARIILRLVKADAGTVRIAGEPVVGGPGGPDGTVDDQRLRQLVQPIFQNPIETFSLHLPVDQYLIRTAINLGDAATARNPEPAISAALSAVGLRREQLLGKGIRSFSGGDLQRISIARALIAKPRLIVADEPVSMVDASLRMTIVNLFRQLSRERGVAFVYITHDLSTACYLSDRMAIMRHGQVVEFGRPEAILAAPDSAYTKALMAAIPTLDRRWID